MNAEIIDKKSGSRRHADDTQAVTLDRPSVIMLKLAPENVARYERRGDDLILVLKDGREIAIHGFFVKYPEGESADHAPADNADGVPADGEHGRNELVLQDDNGVTWWGQYPDQWSEFHFTEIEWNSDPAIAWPWLLGALGAVGLGALAVGSGGGGDRNGGGGDGDNGGDHDEPHPPVAKDDRAEGNEDGGPITGKVLTNDSDPDGDALSVTKFTIGGQTYDAGDTATIAGVGTFTLGSDGSYSFTPAANWNGAVPTVTYTISDGHGGTDTADLTITVNPVADLTAGNDSAATQEDTPVNGTVAPNDSTTSGGELTFVKAGDPGHGTVVVHSDGTYTYTPDADYNGTDSFTYTVTDHASGESLTRTVEITISPVNDAPVAEDTVIAQNSEDGQDITPLDVTSYFSDVDGDTLTYTAEGLPAGLTIDPDTGVISGVIDHSASQDGTDGSYSVTVTASDGSTSADQTFTWTVTNPAPVANDDAATASEDNSIDGNVLGSGGVSDVADSDPDGDPLVVTTFTVAGDGTVHTAGDSVTIADVGTFTLGSDGAYNFEPDADWNGTVPTVTYTISDGEGGTDTADLVITISPVNDAPVAEDTVIAQNSEDGQDITPLDVTSYFSDVDGDTLTYTADGLPAGLTIDPDTGVISGVIDHSASQDGTDGSYSVTVTASDGSTSADQTFTWTVTNPAPVANDDAATASEDNSIDGNVLGSGGVSDVADSDPDGDPLVVTTFTVAGDGTVHTAGDSVTIADVGTFTLGSDGAYNFEPDADWNGTVPTVTYTISDGEGGTDTADLVITISPVNDAPVAEDTVIAQNSEDGQDITPLDVTSYFSDVDGDTLTYTAEGLPAGLTIDPDTGVISGVIDHSASQDGTDGSYSVTVTASDGSTSADQTFTWTVTNPAPVANDDAATASEDNSIDGNVLGSGGVSDVADSDPDGDPLVVTTFTVAGDGTVHTAGDSVTIADVGTFTLGSDGAYNFEPDADWNGTVPTVTYTISDGEGGTDTADLVITISPAGDAPVITESDQSFTVVEAGNLDDGSPVDGTPSASGTFTATDADGDTLTWSVIGTPDATYGEFGIDSETGAWTYTLDNTLPATEALNEGDSIPLTFEVQVDDGTGGTDTQTVTINVVGTNDSPIANADTGDVTEAGVEDNGNIETPGSESATGNVLTNDTDVDAGDVGLLQVAGVEFGGSPGTVGSALAGTFGSLVLDEAGDYTYTLNNADADTDALQMDESATETFTYTVIDTNGATSINTLTITVTGTNDQPIITSGSADATGDVTEQGTLNPNEIDEVSGTLTASDVDNAATQTWSLAATDGTYGTIGIDPVTGEWTYTLDNSRSATQELNDDESRTETFTARVTDEHGAYSEQIVTVTVHGSNDNVVGLGNQTIPLTEDGRADGTLQDYVSDIDDALSLTSFTVDTNGDDSAETYGPGEAVVIEDTLGNPLGTLTMAENGEYSFVPTANYAGNLPIVTYTMTEADGDKTVTQTLAFEITKVSDAPDLGDDKTVNTVEETTVALDLQAPVVTDTGTGFGNGDRAERLGAITLTIGGAGASGATLSTGITTLTPVDGKVTIVLTDGQHTSGMPAEDNPNGIYYLTTDEYEALIAHPPAESGKDFTVTVSVTSYEVDATGTIIASVDGATSTQVVEVDVQAVTDGATLTGSPDDAELTFAEDGTINLSQYLTATLDDADISPGTDTDGSETYWYTVGGLPFGSVVTIDGVATTISAGTPTASSPATTSATPPTITVTPPAHYSGDIENISVTLNSKDTDGDSSGTPDTLTSPVLLDLHVTPVAGDVSVNGVSAPEDTAIAFLANVTVIDTGSGTTGSEVLDSVSFDVPAGWDLVAPALSAGWTFSFDGTSAEITFNNTLNEADREAILDAFTIQPPAHSSVNETITLSITTTDSNTVNGNPLSDTKTVDRDVTITVNPAAEQTDVDSDAVDGNDVKMNGDHEYLDTGREDTWFALGMNYTDAANIGGGFYELSDWANADADEFSYAVLTPTLESETSADTVIGTEFRYSADGGASWIVQIYVGEPLWVPADYLDTLQVKLPPDVSGTLQIGVQAGTVDYDDDSEVTTLPLDPPHVSEAGVNVAVSGSATLSLITFDPMADAVTMALNGHATGLEDTAIPLAIQTTSSDVSETFNVTISGIPVGATITYGTGDSAQSFTATAGNTSFEITDFSNTVPVTVTPPANSNDDFSLTVTAVSVDGTDISDTVSRTIEISVTGVADPAEVTLPATSYSTTEAALDSGDHKVALSGLVASVGSPDNDGSEITTLRITGLPEDFFLTGATAVVSGTGAERVWLVSVSNLSNVSVVVPENYSGTVSFKVAGVTTEDDGDSRTGGQTDVSFTVEPSPESTITPSATLVEDEITLLNLAIVHHGDGNETLGEIYISQTYDTSTYTLYLGGTELSAAGLETINMEGVDYYVVPSDQIGDLGAMGASNLDGDLGSLDFLYQVIDPSSDGTLPATTVTESGSLALTATPVTDAVDASITGIAMTTATGATAENTADDDATPDTALVTGGGVVTVNLHVDLADSDGSEHLIRVLIDGVPEGVTVHDGSYLGSGTWLLVYDEGDALSIGSGGIDVPVEFEIGQGAVEGTSAITMTVLAQDEGQSITTPAEIETDPVQWTLTVDLSDGEIYIPPAIEQWDYNGTPGTEDTAFTLDSVIDAAVSTSDAGLAYSYTVTITDLPGSAVVDGMTFTVIDGVPTWTATVVVPVGGDSQAALDTLLSGITITPPDNSNDNNADFSFDAKLTAAAVGGTSVEADTVADMPVTPMTDEASIAVTANAVGEGEPGVTANIVALDVADGGYGTIVDGKLYVQVSVTAGNEGGTVTDGTGQTLSLSTVSGVEGVPDGDYYIVDIGEAGGEVDLTYTPLDGTLLVQGDVTFTAWAQTQEVNAPNTIAASATGTAEIEIVNNGVTVGNPLVFAGSEPSSSDKSNAIELEGLSVAVTDNDGSESILSILLSGVPVGFLLYVGDSADHATLASQASNAGGDGTTNTWALSTDGTLPGYVALLPAANWSGTLDDLALVVESGEGTLAATRVDTVPLVTLTVEAVANGLTIDPTLSIGTEGRVIDLNLNAAMADAAAATAALADESIETTTVQITGLGEHAAFYIGDDAITSASYDVGTDTYTIAGLSQDDLDDLGLVQAASALIDQDGAQGTQATVTAWTVESIDGSESAHVSHSLTLAVTEVLATTANDNLIWDGGAINGRAGTDTVALRYGEEVSHADLASQLKNVEVIDMSAPGENAITGGLSIADVLQVTGSGGSTLTIDGDADDRVELSSAIEWSTTGVVTDGHVAYTSGLGVTVLIDEDIYSSNHVSYAA